MKDLLSGVFCIFCPNCGEICPNLDDTCSIKVEKELLKYAKKHEHRWRAKGNNYWLKRLMQEVGELASVLADDHEHTIEHELRQIGSIVINWLDKRNSSL